MIFGIEVHLLTFMACKIGYEIVWSPPITNGLQPFSISFAVCPLICSTAFGKSNMFIAISPTSPTINESNGDAPLSQTKAIRPMWIVEACIPKMMYINHDVKDKEHGKCIINITYGILKMQILINIDK